MLDLFKRGIDPLINFQKPLRFRLGLRFHIVFPDPAVQIAVVAKQMNEHFRQTLPYPKPAQLFRQAAAFID